MNGGLSNTTLGRFQVLELIGRGGMGEVYRARDASLGRDLAIKVLPADLVRDARRVERFVQEARAASALNHPHLISIYDIGTEPVHYIAMELVQGRTLRTILDEGTPSRKTALDWLLQISEAVGAAHDAGVVHRDIKPENVMIANEGYVKVLDFGVAKLRSEGPSDDEVTRAGLTEAGVMVGTSGYTSPEQARGLPTDRRTDIFALGCVVYECVTGTRAFDAPSAVDRMHRVMNDEPAPMATRAADVTPELTALVRKCLAKDPADRYQSMKELGVDLRYLRRQLETTVPGSAVQPVVAPPPPNRWALRATTAAAIVAAIVALAAYGPWRNTAPAVAVAPAIGIDRLTSTGNTIDASISRDGRYLLHAEAIGSVQTLWVRDAQSGQDTKVLDSGPFGFFGVQLSPDGESIFYTSRGEGHNNGRLTVVPRAGGESRVLLHGIVSQVTFSPEGRQIAFFREQYPDRDSSALMTADADGTNERVLATRRNPDLFAPAFFTAPSWSPDGATIVASSRDRTVERSQLVAIDARTGAERELHTSADELTHAQWTPDGGAIVFVSRPFVNFAGATGQLWLKPYPDGPARRITNDVLDYRKAAVTGDGRTLIAVAQDADSQLQIVPLDGSAARRFPSQRHDGLQGVAELSDESLIVTSVIQGATQLLRISKDGQTRTMLTREGSNTYPAVSPDGAVVAMVSTRDGQVGVWRMSPDGSDQRLLSHIPTAAWLSFTPDSRYVICSSYATAVPSTWKVPVDGGQAEEVARQFSRGAVSPDGKWLAGQYVPSGNTQNAQTTAAIVPLDGSAPPTLLAPLALATGSGILTWAPDGSGLIISTNERFNLFFFGRNGAPRRALTNLADEWFFRGVLARDGKHVIASRGRVVRDVFGISNFR